MENQDYQNFSTYGLTYDEISYCSAYAILVNQLDFDRIKMDTKRIYYNHFKMHYYNYITIFYDRKCAD